MHLANPYHGTPAGPTCVSPAPAFDRSVPTILLVEDEGFVLNVTYEILCSAGYRVLPARNAGEAVRAFRSHAEGVQLLLTDVVLPDRNGCDLALELATTGGVKAIFISGYPDNSHSKGTSTSRLGLFAQAIFRCISTAESQRSPGRLTDVVVGSICESLNHGEHRAHEGHT